MILHESADGPPYYCFDNLLKLPSLVHGVFTRDGGVSCLNFDSLNVGLSTGDEIEKVLQNRKKLASSMGVDERDTIYLNQVHGENFVVLKREKRSEKREDLSKYSALSEEYGSNIDTSELKADGIITNVKGLLTVIQVADCQAAILYDPVQQVVANIHSGWRGSLLNIIGQGVEIMVEQFHTAPHNILAAIAPSLGPCCAEFKNYRDEIPEELWKYRIGECHFDFWQMSKDQLIGKGVLPYNIEIAKICTPCTSHTFYSYRKENITGRFAVAAGLICNGCDVKVKEKRILALT